MKIVKKILIGFFTLILIFIIALSIYARNPYSALEAMQDEIDLLDSSDIVLYEDRDEITLTVSNPLKQILFIPGGLVEPDSYLYLAYQFALAGYNVTIFKPLYDLAILTPNYPKRFLSDTLDNIVIGHSLGGVVASMFSSNNDQVSTVILLGSYPIKDVLDKDVMIITAEHDIAMDQEAFNDSLVHVNETTIIFDITGGNHAQFGWYGPQKGDGDANIDTLTQQNLVIDTILDFIEN